MIPIEIGQIRVTVNNRKSIIPYAQGMALDQDGNDNELNVFFLLPHSSKDQHYIVISEKVNATSFYVVHLLSTKGLEFGYENILVKMEWVQDKFPWKAESRITKETYLVNEKDIKPDYEYGYFDLPSFNSYLNLKM